ncbi:LysR family transcriptional regulator [Clostridium akagii]|uniref:LysR family transcriptional regulator n=1 Tax=Clostridium akagii TaxID=91623 RepID=UPI00047AC2F2|nr:LysR family transcriptional regulator [Clostridium akagii]
MLKQMKYFVTVVKCNSFTEAAEECYISQSAISQQIRALEEELGVKLICRENRKFSLTPAGEYFYNQSLILLHEAERIRQETVRIDNKNNRQIRIGYLKCYGGQELQHAIAIFTEQHPGIDIHIVNGTHEELYELLVSGEVDLVLNDQRRAFSGEYENFHLYSFYCYIEISTRNALGALDKVTMNDLKRMPCIIVTSKEQQENERDYYQNYLAFIGEFLFVDNLEEGRLLVAGDKGFMPVEGVANIPQVGATMTRLPLFRGDAQLQRDYFAFWKKENSNIDIQSFANILHDMFENNLK